MVLNQQLKEISIKMHPCVVNTVVVWLHILGPYCCLYVVLSGSSRNTGTFWSYFNVKSCDYFYSQNIRVIKKITCKNLGKCRYVIIWHLSGPVGCLLLG